jgi:signal peptidase I
VKIPGRWRGPHPRDALDADAVAFHHWVRMAQPKTNRSTAESARPAATRSRWLFWHRKDDVSKAQKSWLRQNGESIVLAVLVALLVRSSVVEAFWVPSGSMLPTIQIGDHLFVNKLAYGMHLPFVSREIAQWRPLHRGDIVVFRSPVDQQVDLIKRVIAVAGDTVEIRNKRLLINGEAVPDPYANFTDPRVHEATPRDNFGPVTVPPGKFFVMGDNRDQSYDSRYWGFADERDVKGQATFVYWSWDSQNHWLRWNRFGHVIR